MRPGEALRAAGAGRYWWLWIAVAPLEAWTLVRLLGLDAGYPLVPLIAFTPYVAVAAFLVAGAALALRNWAAATVAALATLGLAAAVLPRGIGDGTVGAGGRPTLSVLSANVHHGTANAGKLMALVEDLRPDLLAVQELTPWFHRELLAAAIAESLPNAIVQVRPDSSGGGIYSRLPVRELAEPGGFDFRQPRAELTVPGAGRVRVASVHPFPPTRGNVGTWERALAQMPSAGRGAAWVLAGDFNATLDHSALREVLDRGYRDAGAVAGKGLEPTWPEGRRFGPLVTIDHVLADHRLDIASYSTHELPGTDHRAVFSQLVLPQGRSR